MSTKNERDAKIDITQVALPQYYVVVDVYFKMVSRFVNRRNKIQVRNKPAKYISLYAIQIILLDSLPIKNNQIIFHLL